VQLRHVRIGDPEVAPLLKGLAEEYETRYGDRGEMTSVDAQEFEPPDGAFIVLLEHGVTVAGGALRRLSVDACEVKRMWTAPDRRRRGYASVVLDALEGVARDRGYAVLRLETGPAQPEARSLYRRRGYEHIPTYGKYQQATAFELLLHPGEVHE
jgi:GNAT superfamily N-acetyltransferase